MEPQTPQLQPTRNQQQANYQQKPVGRPPISDNNVQKIIGLLQRGHTVENACEIVGIVKQTFYNHINADPKLMDEVRQARKYAEILAADIVFDVLLDATRNTPILDSEGNPKLTKGGKPVYGFKYREENRINTAKWLLEAKHPEGFGKKPIQLTQQNQQNNYFSLSDEQLRQITNTDQLEKLSEGEIATLLETPNVAGGDAKESFGQVDSEQASAENTPQSSMPQS